MLFRNFCILHFWHCLPFILDIVKVSFHISIGVEHHCLMFLVGGGTYFPCLLQANTSWDIVPHLGTVSHTFRTSSCTFGGPPYRPSNTKSVRFLSWRVSMLALQHQSLPLPHLWGVSCRFEDHHMVHLPLCDADDDVVVVAAVVWCCCWCCYGIA